MTIAATPYSARAELPLAQPERVLTQLGRHFAHKVKVTLEPPRAKFEFAEGSCHLHAGEALLFMQIDADDGPGRDALVATLERHLALMAGAGAAEQLRWRLEP